MNGRCSDTVEAGGLKWAFRQSKADDERKSGKPTVLLLHGIGSNSYCYRNLMRLLSDAGHDCYAPDWPGHGSSEKVKPDLSHQPSRQGNCVCACTSIILVELKPSPLLVTDSMHAWQATYGLAIVCQHFQAATFAISYVPLSLSNLVSCSVRLSLQS